MGKGIRSFKKLVEARVANIRETYPIVGLRADEVRQQIAEQQVMLDAATKEIQKEGITCVSPRTGGCYAHPAVGTRRMCLETIERLYKLLESIQGEEPDDERLEV